MINVTDYGAVGDGVTECGPAIRQAWAAAVAAGGGVVRFPPGTYAINTLDPASPFSMPQQTNTGALIYNPYQVAVLCQNGHDITIDFSGAVVTSTIIYGGCLFLFQGVNRLRLISPTIRGAQVMTTGIPGPLTITSGGSGYVNGTYNNVPLTGGSGGGAVARVTVSGGAVTSIGMLYAGGGYAAGDVVSVNNTHLGGTGSGFSATVPTVDGAGPVVKVAAPHAISVVAVTTSSADTSIYDLNAVGMYTALYCTSDPTLGHSVNNVALSGTTRAENCEYGIALHNAGSNSFIENLYAQASRPFFFYGVENVSINVVADKVNYGLQPLVKAYSLSTRNIHIRYTPINLPGQSGMVSLISFQVQCDPTVVNVPVVEKIYLDFAENNVRTQGLGIVFDYYAGAGGAVQQTSTALQIFDQFVLRGKTASALMTSVRLTGTPCRINADVLQRWVSTGTPGYATANPANGFAQLTTPL